MFLVEPVMRLSTPMTLWPSERRRSVRWDPRKPAPPVTTVVGTAGLGLRSVRLGMVGVM